MDELRAERAGRLRGQESEYRQSAADFRADVTGLQMEKELRARMRTDAPTQHARETQQRAAYLKQARQAKRDRQNAGQRAAGSGHRANTATSRRARSAPAPPATLNPVPSAGR